MSFQEVGFCYNFWTYLSGTLRTSDHHIKNRCRLLPLAVTMSRPRRMRCTCSITRFRPKCRRWGVCIPRHIQTRYRPSFCPIPMLISSLATNGPAERPMKRYGHTTFWRGKLDFRSTVCGCLRWALADRRNVDEGRGPCDALCGHARQRRGLTDDMLLRALPLFL